MFFTSGTQLHFPLLLSEKKPSSFFAKYFCNYLTLISSYSVTGSPFLSTCFNSVSASKVQFKLSFDKSFIINSSRKALSFL